MVEGRCRVPAAFGPLRATVGRARPWHVVRCFFSAMVAVAGISGCAVGPDFQVPPAPDVTGYTRGRSPTQTVSASIAGGAAQRFIRGRDIPGEWWTLFRSRPLKALIEE